jgi:hypothetical protein
MSLTSDTYFNKTIWLLWLQGWEHAYWLNLQVVHSWVINNPGWKIEYVTLDNLRNYVNDIDYIYDSNKYISPAAKSDIIRLSLLKNHGGVWADATMLCMQPLDHWVEEAVSYSGLWMYHGHGADMDPSVGPASWFIVSVKHGYLITVWKRLCDEFWINNDYTDNYGWMDSLFRHAYENDTEFRNIWLKMKSIYCESDGQSHCLAPHNHGFQTDNSQIKEMFLNRPPYALKFWTVPWNHAFPNTESEECQKSTGYYAIQMSKRRFVFKHDMT